MKCEFDYCVNNRHLLCTLDEIQINAIGICGECIIASISEEELEKQLKEIEKRYKEGDYYFQMMREKIARRRYTV